MVGVNYVGPFLDASGYGEATRNFLMAFKSVEGNVMATKVSYTGSQTYKDHTSLVAEEMALKKIPYKIKILHVTPDNYKSLIEPDKYNIGHLFWETNLLPKSWVPACNKLQEIWTGTKYGADVIRGSGVTVPVTITPEAVDTSDIPKDVRKYVLPNFKGIVFYSVFEWTERKNPKVLLTAFWKAFRGRSDVCLLLKVHKSWQTDRGLRDILIEARGWKNSFVWKDMPRVFVHSDIMDYEQMERLHETGDVYVSPHRGEGWGIPQCEASVHLKPIISVGYGGVHEYLTRRDYYPIEFTMVPLETTYNKYYEEGMEWAEASEESLIIQMQKVFERLNDPKKRGLVTKTAYGARAVIRNLCKYENVGDAMVNRIKEISKEKGWNE